MPDMQLATWHAVAYSFAPERMEPALRRFVDGHRESAGRVLLTMVQSRISRHGVTDTVSPPQIGLVLEACVSQFEPMERPNGWVPPEYAITEAAEALITRLSRESSAQVTDILDRLETFPPMAPWRARIAHAKAQHIRSRRDAEYQQPSIESVVDALTAGAPASTADLQALVTDCLFQVKREIENGGTDRRHAFWNTDARGKPIPGEPKIENECRDRILDWLRPMLVAYGVNSEREGDYAQHRRADIKCAKPPYNLPIEIKRQNHADLWSAAQAQLHDRYAGDPGAKGRGIYLVLWFGAGFPITPRPERQPKPTTPGELRDALEQALPDDLRRLIEVIVIDVSPPWDSEAIRIRSLAGSEHAL